jgi:RNase P subunit RPR2
LARRTFGWAQARGGITRAEMAAGLFAAARGAAKNGNKEAAKELRERARRARASIMPRRIPASALAFPHDPKPPHMWSLAKSASRVRRDLARNRRRERRERVAHTKALQLAGRPLIAMTCYGCGKFLPGEKFKRHSRNTRDKVEYVDRRCVDCKWGSRVKRRLEGTENAEA